MARKQRDNTTADTIQVGDLIEPNNNGYRATVTRIDTNERILEPHVIIGYAYPNDFSVNANFRGQSSSKTYRPGNPVTRWLNTGRTPADPEDNSAALPEVDVDLTDLAEDAWKNTLTSGKQDVLRSLNRRFSKGGLTALQHRQRYLRSKPRRSRRDLAELHMLPEALRLATEKETQERPVPAHTGDATRVADPTPTSTQSAIRKEQSAVETLTYAPTDADNDREWRLIHARDAHLKTLDPAARMRVQNARTTCDKCGQDTPVAVRCHACRDWLNEAANPDTNAAEMAVVARDAHTAAQPQASLAPTPSENRAATEITDLETAISYSQETVKYADTVAGVLSEMAAQCATARQGLDAEADAYEQAKASLQDEGFGSKVTEKFDAAAEALTAAAAAVWAADMQIIDAKVQADTAAGEMRGAVAVFSDQLAVSETVGAAAQDAGVSKRTDFYA